MSRRSKAVYPSELSEAQWSLGLSPLSLNGTWDKIVEALRIEVRYSQGRAPRPSAAVIDTQSVKTSEKGRLVATIMPKR